jgi:hypothetical protein
MLEPPLDGAGMLEPRRTFALGVLNGAFFNFAFVFIDPNTVIALFVATATGSEALVGLVAAIASLGGIFPQAFVATRIGGTRRKMFYYHVSVAFRGPALIAMALMVALTGGSPILASTLVLIVYSLYSFGAGFAFVPFMEVVGGTLPPSQRSSFFALRNFTGLLLGIAGGLVVRTVLGSPDRYPFPGNYAIFFGIGAAFGVLSMMSFSLVRNPPSAGEGSAQTFGQALRRARKIVTSDSVYARYLMVRLLIAATSVAAPFYLLHATRSLGFGEATAGLFIMSMTVGGVVSNLAWGRIGDVRGTKIMIVVGAALLAIAPLTALLSRAVPSLPLSLATFAILGLANAGIAIGSTNYLLDHCEADDRPVYVAMTNILAGLLAVSPLIGGLVVEYLGYTLLFTATLLIATAASLMALELPEPRGVAEKRFQTLTRSA